MPELFEILDHAALRMATPQQQVFDNGSFDVITVWDDIVIQGTNLTASTVTNSITVGKPGLYEVTISFNCEFPSTEELAVYGYVNGVQDPSGYLSIQGGGNNKPVALYWSPIITVANVGDIIDLRGTNLDPGSFGCDFLNAQFRAKFVGDIQA